MKFFRALITLLILLPIICVAGLFGVKNYISTKAETQIGRYLATQPAEFKTVDQKLLHATRHVHEHFKVDAPKCWPVKFQAYLTHESLPDFLRVSQKDLEKLHPEQTPQEAVKMLERLLGAQNIKTEVWHIISPGTAHKVLVVVMPGGMRKLLDPYFGATAMYENRIIIGPRIAQELVLTTSDPGMVFVGLDDTSDIGFYADYEETMMAPEGEALYLNMAAPVFEEPLVLGEVDGFSDDVARAAGEIRLTPYMDYIGPKHEQGWVRSFHFTDAAKVIFVLTRDYEGTNAPANLKPEIEGRNLIWDVPEGEALIFEDGKAGLSFSGDQGYIAIDQIIIEAL